MKPVYELHVRSHFSAAHCLVGYEGDCSRVHGHNWVVDVFVKCGQLNDIGIGIDFREVKKAVEDVLLRLDHMNLNDLEPFRKANPTSENVARFLYQEIGKVINASAVQISRVKVSETPGAGALYWEE